MTSLGPSGSNGESQIGTARTVGVTLLCEIIVLGMLTTIFLYVRDITISHAPPPMHVIQTIDCTKNGLLTVELIFVLFSLIVSFVLIFKKKDAPENWDSFKLFAKEMRDSGYCMLIMFACAGLIYASDKMQQLMFFWVLVVFFYGFAIGFFGLALTSTFNAAKVKWQLVRAK